MQEVILQTQANSEDDSLPDQERDLNVKLNEELTTIVQPVRRWHTITSKHHIISNNMTVNSNFFNAIAIPGQDEVFVQFDPGLDDRRTKYVQELSDMEGPTRGFMAASMLRDEMRKMYRGEIVIVGNPAIRAHDILVISDDIRQIFGIVEVDKVIHTMDTQNGFISVITPALVCEVGDN